MRRVDDQENAQDERGGEDADVDDVLALVGDGALGDPLDLLELAGGHEAAGEGEEAEDDLDDEGRHSEGGELEGRRLEREEELGRADEAGRDAAEGMGEGGPLGNGGQRNPGEGNADEDARGCRDDEPGQVPDAEFGAHEGSDDGHGHGGDAGVDAASGRLRAAHPHEGENEERGRDEVRDLNDGFCHDLPFSFVLNILSMRFVMRKPETMLVIEANKATAPSIVM